MAVGQRKPIVIRKATITDEEGGAHDESYTDEVRVFAKVTQRSSNIGFATGQRQMAIVYEFDEVRVGEFVPDITMTVVFEGVELVIDSVVNKGTNPPYYRITATQNG